MEYIIILVICLISMIILKFAFNVTLKNINRIKEIGYDKQFNEITNALPDNKVVCDKILHQLANPTVKIKEAEERNKTLTYYSVMTNQIVIANIKDTFTRIQTIAHECIHSIQSHSMLQFNFIFSNIYVIYFILIMILTICKIVPVQFIHVSALLLMGLIYYAIRSYLETDAMTRAPYLAKEYMEKEDIISKEEIGKIIENYEMINHIGIPMTNFMLIMKVISKVMMYCMIAICI